ncbi:MAG: hypothetical protein LW863_09190 [Flammeovirgaceae bacterium]|nr:hypothetical protein [Flammeovirgaceae bacterium]
MNYRVYTIQKHMYDTLHLDLKLLPNADSKLPFHEYIHARTDVLSIKADAERLLWHQRLGHPSDYYLFNAHKYVDGVPRFTHMDPVFDTCPTCIQAKQKKEPAGPNSTMKATLPFQGLSMDFSFSGITSKNANRRSDYTGLNGETCWFLVSDHYTGMLFGDTRISKSSPFVWLEEFLRINAPPCTNKYVYLDQGGELYANPRVVSLFQRFGYTVLPTGADSSNQNGPVERAHQTVANAIRALLLGANLDARFWPYAFHHYLRLKNSIPSRHRPLSPVVMATSRKDNFKDLRTFGCRVWVRPSGRRPIKLKPNSRKGIFLGYIPNTRKNILWFDIESQRVKIAKHARFDEGFNDVPITEIPPNVQHLQRARYGERLPTEQTETSIAPFECFVSPFSHTLTATVKVKASNASPTFGFNLNTDALNDRVYVKSISPTSSAAAIFGRPKSTNNKIRGAYIISINDTQIFTKEQAFHAFRKLFDNHVDSFEITFAPEPALSTAQTRVALAESQDKYTLFAPNAPSSVDEPSLSTEDLRAISSILYTGDFSTDAIPSEIIDMGILALESAAITPEEKALGHFTRRKLKTLSTWPEWQAGEFQQLDQFRDLGMYGNPCVAPPGAVILRMHWQYKIKRDGTRRSRQCCDGSPRAAPTLHRLVSTYSSCVEQPIQRLFYALAAELGYKVFGGDAKDAYAHSPAPGVPTFVHIDDAYAEWYHARYGIHIDRHLVLPVLHALQGHPESGRLWEVHINGILQSDALNFRTTTHDRTIYRADFNGDPVLLLRQVDDFSLACRCEPLAKHIFDVIGERLRLPGESTPPFVYLGLVTDFNGVDIQQRQSYIEISATTYISRLLKAHGWDTPSPSETTSAHTAPLPTNAIESIYNCVAGPDEFTQEHADKQRQHKFSYRQLLGELLYAYVTCRPDIGYACVTLSKFASHPADNHYILLKGVAKYLRRTSSWGLRFHRHSPDLSLPPDTPYHLSIDTSLPTFPPHSTPFHVVGYVDAAHANDLRNRRSTTGYAFCLANAAIAYRSKTQTITATSSTEAEFLAAVSAAKTARYLRSILTELGFPPQHPTILYIDNQSTIQMINSRQPTERARHIDIQWFAIQEWKENGDILTSHIAGILNPSDDLSKPLGWILHARHCRRLMGHYM